jgi:glycosyltransferase involved in cell wall biosynthesis
VLLIAPSLDFTGGQAVQAQRLLQLLRELPGVEVDFFGQTKGLPFGLARLPGVRTLAKLAEFLSQLLVRLPKCDVLHIFSASYWAYLLWPVPAMALARLMGKKVVINYRSGEAEDHLKNWPGTVMTLRLAHEIVAPSAYLVTEVFGPAGLASRTILNILDPKPFTYREREKPRPVFFTNRGLEAHYNVACVIRAFARIQARYPEASLDIAHDGPCRRQLEQLVETLNLRNVRFLGSIPSKQMAAHYSAADIYLMAPDLDCMPGTLLECFASGLPVVSTDAGGIPYVLESGRTGLLVNRNDDENMAACAIRLLEEPGLALELTRAAHAECARYDGQQIAREWAALYRNLTAEPRR